uniref:Uncharacterized protein n=1 Tax=Pseudo-nitzschia australis TaxID=44445 RepID=A0A7S4A9B6_9STRA
MIKDIFTCYHSHLPQSVQESFDEDDVWILKNGDRSFDDLFADCGRWTFEEFYSFVKKRVVFITPDTGISGSCDTPSHHKYTVDMTFIFSTTTIKSERTLHVSGTDAQTTSPALNFLLRLVLECYSDDEDKNSMNSKIGVILKCFATTPRQLLGSLDLSAPESNANRKRKDPSSTQSACNGINNKIDIEFRFLALNKSHCEAIFGGSATVVSCVKFSQCEVDEWTIHDKNDQDQNSGNTNNTVIKNDHGVTPKKLVLSCTQHEFRKFTEGRLLTSNNTSIRDMSLVLHFMLADLDVHHLISTLGNNQSLEHLSIEYLDLDDKTWTCICKALYNHPKLKRLRLAYTEKFADSYRRLTPERRRIRTNDLLKLLQTNKNLQEVQWPKFQQDETLILDVERLLMENMMRASTSPGNTN